MIETMQRDPFPRAIPARRGAAWISEGFEFFKEDALSWIGASLLFFIISLAVSVVPILGSLAVYFLTTLFFGGLMLGCHARQQGGEFSVNHLFAGFSQNTPQLLILGGIYLAGNIIIIILVIVSILFLPGGGMGVLEKIASNDPVLIREMLAFVSLVVLIALALYLPLIMAMWFAPALVMLQDVSAVRAMQLSFMACLLNIVPYLIYGILALVLMILAAIPFGLGFLVLFPVITASIYAAWREIFQPAA
ncbi:MAG TPA: BPSS1780 family membrane protein [Gammaproteobacteria bacterium]|nr:BPSS1780 family membrane protein [Gammaproteobacteria bacterium]